MIALRGTVKVEYVTPAGVSVWAPNANVDVAKTVKVHATILRNGNAQAPGDPVITESTAHHAIHKANEQLAQVGILLLPNYPGILTVDPKGTVDLTNGLDGFRVDSNRIIMTPEEQSLLDSGGFQSPNLDDVELLFVNYFSDKRGGEAFAAEAVPAERYADIAIIGVRDTIAEGDPFAVAHEIGHLITNRDHYTGDFEPVNLMRRSPSKMDRVSLSKRLSVSQQVDILGDPNANPPNPPKPPRRPNLLTGP